MLSPVFPFARLSRVAVIALALAGAGLAALPAQAAGGPAMNFNLTVPGGPNAQVAVPTPGYPTPGYPPHPGYPPNPGRYCLTDWQVIGELQSYGWRHVQLGQQLPRFRVIAYGIWGRFPQVYSMVVDRCTGDVNRVHPAGPPPGPFPPGPPPYPPGPPGPGPFPPGPPGPYPYPPGPYPYGQGH